jgi:hypothetical protein
MITFTKVTSHSPKEERCGKKKTKAANCKHREKIKRKCLLEKLDATDEDFIPDDANQKEPPENIGKKNQKVPPETIEERNSNAIIPPADMKSKSKSNDGNSNGGVNAMLSLPFLADEVDDKEPKCQAFVAVNYSPKIGEIGMCMHYFSFQSFVIVMNQLNIVFTIIVFIFYMNSFLHQIHI